MQHATLENLTDPLSMRVLRKIDKSQIYVDVRMEVMESSGRSISHA